MPYVSIWTVTQGELKPLKPPLHYFSSKRDPQMNSEPFVTELSLGNMNLTAKTADLTLKVEQGLGFNDEENSRYQKRK